MLIFGPTLHHPSTKHQALVKDIKMQHLANLLEKNPKKKFTKFSKMTNRRPLMQQDMVYQLIIMLMFNMLKTINNNQS
jgi:hypothetical protein